MITVERMLHPPEATTTLDRPLDHLVACHRRIEERLAILERVAGHLESRRQEALEAAAACFRFFDSNGVWHTADEEESLFPRLRPRLTAEELAYIEQLEQQHREADTLYVELKSLAGAAEPGDRFRALVARLSDLYRSHIASEDRTLIALGRRALTEVELSAISGEMKRRRRLT